MLFTGMMLALTVLLLLWKMPRAHNAALKHPALGDISITAGVVILGLFTATFSGLMAGAIAGILLSIYFSLGSKYQHHREERAVNTEPRTIVMPQLPRIPLPSPPKLKPKLSFIESIELEIAMDEIAERKQQEENERQARIDEVRASLGL